MRELIDRSRRDKINRDLIVDWKHPDFPAEEVHGEDPIVGAREYLFVQRVSLCASFIILLAAIISGTLGFLWGFEEGGIVPLLVCTVCILCVIFFTRGVLFPCDPKKNIFLFRRRRAEAFARDLSLLAVSLSGGGDDEGISLSDPLHQIKERAGMVLAALSLRVQLARFDGEALPCDEEKAKERLSAIEEVYQRFGLVNRKEEVCA